MRGLLAAFSFLTLLPVPASVHRDVRALATAPPYYPLVGAALGLAGLLFWKLFGFLPAGIMAVALALLQVVLTRAIHIDGLGDTFDGLLAAGTVRQKQDIMRDPRLGTFGVLAVVFDLLARIWLYAYIGLIPASALVAAPLLGRFSILIAISISSYSSSGKLRAAAAHPGWRGFLLAGVWLAGYCLFWASDIPQFLASLAAAGIMTWTWVALVRRRLGRISGDTLGALNELVEITALLVFLLYPLV